MQGKSNVNYFAEVSTFACFDFIKNKNPNNTTRATAQEIKALGTNPKPWVKPATIYAIK